MARLNAFYLNINAALIDVFDENKTQNVPRRCTETEAKTMNQ